MNINYPNGRTVDTAEDIGWATIIMPDGAIYEIKDDNGKLIIKTKSVGVAIYTITDTPIKQVILER